ncbi:MAG TPA: hypothetical protein VD929_07040 [Caulobacteraceae bacterium]|nr:hypothetical protein [Caulobacteraceae bacterium]
MAFPLLVLALLASDPAADAPVSTAQPAAVSAPVELQPAGAPTDDFAFVAWCHGVLSGHMEIAERVHSILPMDEVQQKIGKAYIKGYEAALAAAPQGAEASERERAKAARESGFRNWDKARAAELQVAADTYLGWQLPGKCEHAAKRVSGRDDLFSLAPTLADLEADGPVARSGVQAPPVSTAPAPELTPEPAQVAAPSPDPAPETAPAPAAPVAATKAKAEPKKIVDMPAKGRLLPSFLRRKK